MSIEVHGGPKQNFISQKKGSPQLCKPKGDSGKKPKLNQWRTKPWEKPQKPVFDEDLCR